ncbi:hypothetical protein BLOT_000679 [Blomia tropicalis]|nr:hypothetical protein BLOT_000679 [Blomia tropicalis]
MYDHYDCADWNLKWREDNEPSIETNTLQSFVVDFTLATFACIERKFRMAENERYGNENFDPNTLT